MHIEESGLNAKAARVSDPTEVLLKTLLNDYNITLDNSSASKILQLSYNLYAAEKARSNREWKTKISWAGLFKWRYFAQVTITTVGK